MTNREAVHSFTVTAPRRLQRSSPGMAVQGATLGGPVEARLEIRLRDGDWWISYQDGEPIFFLGGPGGGAPGCEYPTP